MSSSIAPLDGLQPYTNPYGVELCQKGVVQIFDASYEEFVQLDAQQVLNLSLWIENHRDALEQIILQRMEKRDE